MPAFDGTGPKGQGPMTGRGLGPCGRGFAFRGGFGRSFGWRRFLTLPNEEKKKILEEEIKLLEEQLKATKEELENLT